LSPNNISSRDNLATSFLAQGRVDEADQATNDLAKISPDAQTVPFSRFIYGFLRGDQAAMDAQRTIVKGKPEEADAFQVLAALSAYHGKLNEATSFDDEGPRHDEGTTA
jgi:hypothetical protein